jgi:hypothetical protein
MERLRSTYRAPRRRAARGMRWFSALRRKREPGSSAGTADIA